MSFFSDKWRGIVLCAVLAVPCWFLGKLVPVVGAPVFAILLGMLVALVWPVQAAYKSGVGFVSKKVLQYAVILLGFGLNISVVLATGKQSLPIIVCTIATSLIVAYVLHKVMNIPGKISTLIGVGSSICGGSAIAATAPVIDADDEDVARSISVIFLFNVLAALIFPTLGHAIGLGTEGFAVFAGTAVNDTSSVTAAASTAEGIYRYSGILSAAVTVKLTRTLAIIPITLVLALYRTAKAKKSGGSKTDFSIKKIFPWFILFFIGASLITTVCGLLPENSVTLFYSSQFVPFAKWLAKFFIAMAMGAIGLNTNIVKLIRNGGKPILLGLCCWVSITAVSLGVQSVTGLFTSNL